MAMPPTLVTVHTLPAPSPSLVCTDWLEYQGLLCAVYGKRKLLNVTCRLVQASLLSLALPRPVFWDLPLLKAPELHFSLVRRGTETSEREQKQVKGIFSIRPCFPDAQDGRRNVTHHKVP